MKKYNLSADEKDVLSDIFYHEGLRPLLKVMEQMVEEGFGRNVLTAPMNELEASRHQYEGAKRLFKMLQAEVAKSKEK